MTTPTRQEIIDAHEALAVLIRFASRRAEGHDEMDQILAWDTAIGAIFPPLPRPTMAEVEWDDDKHYLAEAEHVTLGKVVMIHPATDARIRCLCKWYGPHWVYNLTPAHLTPTGKRYTLTEAQE
ncbi:hypothetical protein [Corynebacterium marquesiae]|uniref:hypothetical protein n=1 Tax=Corynebacterium marquesiae TaxID=2913503 RepID=UPI0038D0238D